VYTENLNVDIIDLMNFEEFSLLPAIRESTVWSEATFDCSLYFVGKMNNHSFYHDGLRIVEIHVLFDMHIFLPS
jgi:hypothetical protein